MHTLPMPFTPNEEENNKATIYFQEALKENESDEGGKVSDEKISQMFSIFMTRIANLDELVDVASRFLVGYQQALEFIRRPSIDMNHIVLERLVRANSTRKLSSYIESGCFNSSDSKQNISKLHTCHLGLLDHVVKAKKLVKELESVLDDAEEAVLAAMDESQDNDVHFSSSGLSQSSDEKVSLSVHRKRDVTDYAILMASVFWMVKKDFKMQEKVVSALSLKSSSEELESYCMMWSLRPFIDDEIIEKAWRDAPLVNDYRES